MVNSENVDFLYYWSEKLELDKDRISTMKIDLTVGLTDKGVCWISLGDKEVEENLLQKWTARWHPKAFMVKDEARTLNARTQIKEYLSGQRRQFDLILDPKGTPFQRKVWDELLKIPYGETRSYADIANAISNPKGQRAVGMANHNNAIIVVIPCHRVIGKNGSLTGYGGGLELKRLLLKLEGAYKLD